MVLRKLNFNGYLWSDIAVVLDYEHNDNYSSCIEEIISCSDLVPSNCDDVEYVAVYWENITRYFDKTGYSELAQRMRLLQEKVGAEKEDLVFVSC